MKLKNFGLTLTLIILPAFLLSACGKKTTPQFSNDSEAPEFTPLNDTAANAAINIAQTYKINQEFKVKYKTYNPDGEGLAEFKARSIKEIDAAGTKTPGEGKKLVLVEISVKGNSKNKGTPSTFNQIGDYPSPQFVLLDKAKNHSEVETTYFSDGYTESKKLFELSKITLDHEQWVSTAIVFEIDKNITPDLALRFTNPEGKVEFYDLE
jgi:hypothetical protein